MKPFDLEAAKRGEAVCTHDGRPVRIVCFDFKSDGYGVIALILTDGRYEALDFYDEKGRREYSPDVCGYDLFMAPKTVTKWMNVYKYQGNGRLWDSPEECNHEIGPRDKRVACVKVEWEE